MGDEFSGKDLVVEFGTTDISEKARRIRFSQAAGDPKTADITHKGDPEDQSLELRGSQAVTTADFSCLGETGDSAALLGFEVNDVEDLVCYPEGKVHSYPMLTLADARLVSLDEPYEYDKEVELGAQFKAFSKLTRSTYSSAT